MFNKDNLMKNIYLPIFMISTFTLTACGGGSDSTQNNNVNVPTPTINNSSNLGNASSNTNSANANLSPTNTNSATNITHSNVTKQPTLKFGRAVIDTYNSATDKKISTKLVQLPASDLNVVIVDGKRYELGQNIHTDNLTLLTSKNYFNHVKVGLIDTITPDQQIGFYQGNQTALANMPTTGKITYAGIAQYGCDVCDDFNATAKIDVDFANKTLVGVLADSNGQNRHSIKANIYGNTFSGNYDNYVTQGAFFGNNAEELAGIFTNDSKGVAGAFGAKR